MVIFEVNFIFCLPLCLFLPTLCIRDIQRNILMLTILKGKNPFVLCFDHLAEAMYLNTVDCLYYYNSVFYRVVLNNCQYPKKVVIPVIEEV